MRQGVRLIATDLDGTLLRSDRTVSQRTRETIATAQAAGVTFVIATARHPLTARLFAQQAGITGLAICANGALVYDLASDEVVARSNLPAATALAVINGMRSAVPDVCFALLQGMNFACEPGYVALASNEEHGRDLALVVQGDASTLLDVPLTKLIIRHPELSPPYLFAKLQSLGLNEFEASLSGAPFVDVVATGVSKAAALATICADLGIDACNVVAFGDAPNDLAMLRWAGRPIAVANAYPEVLTEVSQRTASNDDDGVARAIEQLLA
jgi:Cof subfamily protein (haloacid dehalogenase superfamily)